MTATPRQLVEIVAEVTGVSAATVTVHDRNLATAPVPLRSVAGRGRAVAKVTAGDAANLVIAVAASESVKDSVATVNIYRDLRGKKDKSHIAIGVPAYDELPANHTLGQGLAALIDAAAAAKSQNFDVTFYWPKRKVRIDWGDGDGYSGVTYESKSKLPPRVDDLKKTTSISQSTIFRIGYALAEPL
jgi:hypothetical protein